MDKLCIYGALKTCPVCGESFRKRDADSKRYVARYCSHACRNRARVKHKERQCVECGRLYKPNNASRSFCSRPCYARNRERTHIPSNDVLVRKKMASFCCGVMHRCMRGKSDKTRVMLGYGAGELKSHLESMFEPGMSWENYGNRVGCWSIDHTRPISSFPSDAKVSEINALSNLRPMWHSQNCSKRDKWEGH